MCVLFHSGLTLDAAKNTETCPNISHRQSVEECCAETHLHAETRHQCGTVSPWRMGANAAAAAVQYPLDMGRKGDRGGNGTVALAMDASGNIK